jgi:NAD+ diphosphatase
MSADPHQHTFAGNRLDRAGDRRDDPRWLAAQLADPRAVSIALWNGQPLLQEGEDGQLRAARLDGGMARELAAGAETLLFLGLSDEGPVLAIDLDGVADPAEGTLQGLGRFTDLRAALPALDGGDANMIGAARSLFEWRRKHRFCSVCGHPSHTAEGGWRRVCPSCGAQHFPRVDPCVIMLPVRGERCLLGRQAAWAPGRFSALAGFVEPGESVEEACAREVREEAALTVSAVRYHSSQPWPFPSNLMIGLIAEVEDGEARPDLTELEAVRWLTRSQARDLAEGKLEGALAPTRTAIAYHLIRDWAFGGDGV